MLTLRGPYCVLTEGSVTTRHDMTARHRHDVAIDNPGWNWAPNSPPKLEYQKQRRVLYSVGYLVLSEIKQANLIVSHCSCAQEISQKEPIKRENLFINSIFY
jgi:hypothetical protein